MDQIENIIKQRIKELAGLLEQFPDDPNSSIIQARLTEAKHIQSLIKAN